MPFPLGAALIGGGAVLGGLLSRRKRKKSSDIQKIEPPSYPGYTFPGPEEFGFSPSQVRPLSEQYARQISERSRGQGLVGFEPERRNILKRELLGDLSLQEEEAQRRASAQASAQGLRGGVPLSISELAGRQFSRARSSGLAAIDIADLEARRQDINRATYAQPQFAEIGAGLARQKYEADLSRYEAGLPAYVVPEPQPPSNVFPAIAGALGTIGGAYLGRPDYGALGTYYGGVQGGRFPKSPPRWLRKVIGAYNLARTRTPH